jgi:CheY-like chemotaxis protein/DNA-binding Xre family transcriptional regulator
VYCTWNVAEEPRENISVRFGVAVKRFRHQLGVSQEKLAERAGLHRTYVADVERGARNLSLSSIEKLARALEISIADLLSRAGNPDATIAPVARESHDLVDILMVEDNRADVELTLHAFMKININNPIHVVHDGAEALDYLFCSGKYSTRKVDRRPQFVLLDLNLPEITGMEVLRRMKADERTRKIPVVVLTASHRDRDIIECRRLGADTYIVKPVGIENFSTAAAKMGHRWMLVNH